MQSREKEDLGPDFKNKYKYFQVAAHRARKCTSKLDITRETF